MTSKSDAPAPSGRYQDRERRPSCLPTADAPGGKQAAGGGQVAPGWVAKDQPSPEGVTRPWEGNPVGFAVVGLGMGHVRSKQITQTPGVRLVGVCDKLEDRARRTGQECGVPYGTDLRRWLDSEEVEVVFVLTETGRHGEVALEALAAGKHVLTTKPMEASLSACDEMIRLAEGKGLLLGVDFERRHSAETQALKAAVARGRFGRLLSATCSLKVQRTMEYFRANGGWRGTRRWDGGGVLSNQTIHHIDEIAFTVGIPAQVRANVWTLNHDIEAEDLAAATWRYDDGLVVTLLASTNYPHSTWYYHYEMEGTQGAYASTGGGPWEAPRARWFLDGTWSDRPAEPVQPQWLNSMDNFAAVLRGACLPAPGRQGAACREELTCSGRDGRRTQAILEAMYRSAYQAGGGWVDVEPELP